VYAHDEPLTDDEGRVTNVFLPSSVIGPLSF
jgi:hypothetical protein